jgi:hypothetical protein
VINTENYVRKFANTVLERDGRYLSREKMNPRNFFGELKRRNVCENMHRLSHRRLGTKHCPESARSFVVLLKNEINDEEAKYEHADNGTGKMRESY